MASLFDDKGPSRTDGNGIPPPLHGSKGISREELWRILEVGKQTERIQRLLKKYDVCKVLLHEPVSLKRLRCLFSLQIPQQTRLMLMSILGGINWFQELPQADQEDIKRCFRERTVEKSKAEGMDKKAISKPTSEKVTSKPISEKATSKATSEKTISKPTSEKATSKPTSEKVISKSISEKVTSKPTSEKVISKKSTEKPGSDKPDSEDSTSKLPKVTPVPVPTPGSTPSEKASRVFMAKRTGRTTVSPQLPNSSLPAKVDEQSAKSGPASPQATAVEEDRPPEAVLAKKRALDTDSSDDNGIPDVHKRQKQSEPTTAPNDTSESEWNMDSSSRSSSVSLGIRRLLERRRSSVERGGSEQEVEAEDDAESDTSSDADTTSEHSAPNLVVSDIPTPSESGMDIPDAIPTAPSGRRYNKWIDDNGALVTSSGALIPDYYKVQASSHMPFLCPIRDCRQAFSLMSGLGHHFSASHNSQLLNDNLDGTLSRIKVANFQGRLGARIISQKGNSSSTALPAVSAKRSHRRKTDRSLTCTTAPSGRKYTALPVGMQDKDMRDNGFGVIFPDGYEKSNYPGNPWICPVRNCRRVFPQLPNLGSHFTRQHRYRQLNDNGDGTLSEVGRHQDSHASVISQIRRAASDLEPLADPSLPAKAMYGGSNDNGDMDRSRSSTDGGEQPPPPPPPPPPPTQKPALAETATPSSTATTATWEYIKPFLIKHKYGGILQTGYVNLFAPLPRVREICWNAAWIKSHPFLDTLPRDVSSLMMQVTGEQSILPCHACRSGRGPYHGCVIVPPHAPVELHATTLCCANCLYHCNQAYCTLRESLHDRFGKLFPNADMNAERARMNVPRYEQRRPDGEGGNERHGHQSKDSVKNGLGGSAADKSTAMGRRSERIAVRESIAEVSTLSDLDVRRPASADSVAPVVPKKVTPIAPPVPPGSQGSRGSSFRSTPTTATTPVIQSSANPVALAGATEPPLGDLLEMEDWEVAPGRLQVERAVRPGGEVRTENVAFSNAFLTTAGQQMVRIDHNISFRVEVVKPGATHVFDADPRATHVCSLASGKLRVRVDDAEFILGPHGMFQVRPGQRYTVRNSLYVDAYLHVSALRNLP